jgi:DNA repair exonuclease SbcCD ATPase subunit
MIKFKKIRYKNFLSTGNFFTEVFLDKNDMTLIIGSNGVGKSSILDAITFALFGKSFRNINKPQLINSINQKNMVVELEFSISAKKYKIIRGLKPNVFEIHCNGELLNQDAKSKDYQELLEKNILKFNYKAFTQIVILGRSSFTPFMLLSAADRRTIIEELLDIQIFSSMNAVLKDKMMIVKNETLELKRNMDTTISKIEMQKKYVEEAKKNTEDQLERLKKELHQTVSNIEKKQNECDLIQKHTNLLIDSISDESSIKQKINELTKYEAKIENNVLKIKQTIQFFNENSTCPTCDQSIQNKDIKISESQDKISQYEEGLSKIQEEIEKQNSFMDMVLNTQRKIRDHQSEIKSIQATVAQMQSYADRIAREITEIKNRKIISDDMLQMSKNLVDDLKTLEEQRQEYSTKKKYMDVASALLKDGGIKSKIIKQYLPIINKLVNKYLSAMNFMVNFEMDEEFKETIKSRYRDDFSYENFSEGERMRIDLALMLTWRTISKMKNSMNTNLLILDEVFDSSLDATGTEDFMKLLQSLGKDANIYVISHKGDVLIDKFNHTLRFEKVKNFSQLKV